MAAKQPRGEHRLASRIQRGLEVRAGWWDRLLEQPVLWGALAVLVATWLLLPSVGPRVPQWVEGEVATSDVAVAQELVLPDEVQPHPAPARKPPRGSRCNLLPMC